MPAESGFWFLYLLWKVLIEILTNGQGLPHF
jgi:hypothetical protein